MKTIHLFLIFILTSFSLTAQNLSQSVRGVVVDKDSQEPIPGATIVLIGSSPLIGAATDVDGAFKLLKVPTGRHTFKISCMGYDEISLSNTEVFAGKEVVLNIEMQEAINKLDEIVISGTNDKTVALNEMSLVSARTFSVEETGRYAGSRNDLSRMAANYAGVSSNDDSRNDIIIRGNSPSGLLWRFEGMDIPAPNHFSTVGSSGGPVSMLNYNVISNSDFMTGAFTADYGNALSGVFDIRMRNGNNEKSERMFQFGAMGTELMLEGPFSKNYKGSYLVNYRFSTTSILSAMGIDFGYPGKADYQDAAFKINLPTKKYGTFNIFGMGGNSYYKVDNEDKDEDSFDPNGSAATNEKFITNTAVLGLSHLINITKNSYLKTVAGITSRGEIGKIDSINLANMAIPNWRSNNGQTDILFHTFYHAKLNAKYKLRTGFMYDALSFKIDEDKFMPAVNDLYSLRNGNGTTGLLQLYTNLMYSPLQNFSINAGLHGQYLLLNDKWAIEPRLSANYSFAANQSINIGYGLHSQMQILPVYFVTTRTANGDVLTNKELDFNKSHHFVLGYKYNCSKNLNFKIETYYQSLYNIPVTEKRSSYSILNEGSGFILPQTDSLENTGTGRNYGLELTVEKTISNGYYFLITTSLFSSKYKGSDGAERNTAFNGAFVINALAGKEIKTGKNSKLIFDVKLCNAGGRYFTPINEKASQEVGYAIENESAAFSVQQKNYFRTDFKVTFRLNSRKITHEFFINIDNVFNNKNIFAQIYSRKTNKLENIYQLGIFPTFQYKIMF